MPASTPDRGGPRVLQPHWPAPAGVNGFVTLRAGGVSRGPWGLADGTAGGWNLGEHCGDASGDVTRNRALLRALLPGEPVWLNQVHGVAVHDADSALQTDTVPSADAAVTNRRGRVLAVMTADCLSVMLTNHSGTAVGLAHAGWRGLCSGVLEATVEALSRKTEDHRWIAWLGPAIGPACFEVGDDVRSAFLDRDSRVDGFFRPGLVAGKWFGDLPGLARARLEASGVRSIVGADACTVSDPARFYSFRRDRQTGRMASVLWLA